MISAHLISFLSPLLPRSQTGGYLRLRDSFYSFWFHLLPPTHPCILLLLFDHKSMSFSHATPEGICAENSAAPLRPPAKADRQEGDAVREGSQWGNCGPTVLRRLLRTSVDHRCPEVSAASAVSTQWLPGPSGLRSAASLPFGAGGWVTSE